jgi:hypothetical protein
MEFDIFTAAQWYYVWGDEPSGHKISRQSKILYSIIGIKIGYIVWRYPLSKHK